ncbi:TIGR03564 family F420-dependent LLM class oxidoreductase [Nonomuraea africana]|uniref:F420-dependent oxidoreductase-like protein n=1 Tax=Nonomuraea africana TaxID=46171 RepID=A0ABR9KG36_9ACTN|nr:TIGR03564 family F420-dependent LLM class oxidoreductase [Nonomuraea africana]MBE1560954.1 F420-dependent oxidoreductase-like protein [Nonomuraea africana]
MRVGLLLNEPQGPDPIGGLREAIAQAADDGFASAWLSHVFGLDAITALAVAGGQTPGIELGTAVVPTYPRHPAALAQQALTANAALGGRLALGIGLSHQIVIEHMFGYDFSHPARHMKEYLDILLPLARGEKAEVSGETLKANIKLSTPGTGLPVLIAALAPRMLALAGAVADGTVLWMTGPKTVAEHVVPAITGAAHGAGRPAPRVVCALPVCVTDDPAAARARAAEVFSVYGQLPSYRAMLDREGAATPGDVAIVGDEEAVRAQIDGLAKAGVTDFVAAEFAERERTRTFLKGLLG